jgi:ribosomal protein L44E
MEPHCPECDEETRHAVEAVREGAAQERKANNSPGPH